MKKIICIDLDGVLNNYNGAYSEKEIAPIKDGAFEFIKKLASDFSIEIFTVRGCELVWQWVMDNNLKSYIHNVTNKKNPLASVFLDDSAVTFTGDFDCAYESIVNFMPHWKE